MKTNNLIVGAVGIGVCAMVAVYIYRYIRSAHGARMRAELLHQMHEGSKWAETLLHNARSKASESPTSATDNMSQQARKAADRLQRHMNAVAVE